jgi:hypothetical protein
MNDVTHFPRTAEVVGYVKHHEKLIALALLLVIGWFGYGRILAYWESHDQKIYDKDRVELQAQVEKNRAVADANAQLAADYKGLAERAVVQAERLTAAITARDTATRQQQQTDRALPPDALAARWQELVHLPPLAVQPRTDATFSVTQPAAVETVVMLEEVPKLQGNLRDTQVQLTDARGVIGKGREVITGLNVQVDGLNVQLVDQQKVCVAQLNLEKAKARKAKRSWFVRGVVAGAVAAVAVLRFGR